MIRRPHLTEEESLPKLHISVADVQSGMNLDGDFWIRVSRNVFDLDAVGELIPMASTTPEKDNDADESAIHADVRPSRFLGASSTHLDGEHEAAVTVTDHTGTDYKLSETVEVPSHGRYEVVYVTDGQRDSAYRPSDGRF